MRLRNVIRSEREEAPLDEQVQAELDALDAALAGQEVPAGMEGLATLVDEIRAESPEPTPDFTARLDAWHEAGFERGQKPAFRPSAGGAGGAGSGRRSGLGSIPPRRLFAPVGAVAVLVVVGAVAISQMDTGSEDLAGSGGGDFAVSQDEAAPNTATTSSETADPAGAGADTGAIEATFDALDRDASGLVDSARYKGNRHFLAPDAAVTDARLALPFRSAKVDGAAAGQDKRKVERDAQLTLGAPPDEVQDVTNEAIGVADRYDGVVLSSRISGSKKSATATLDLQVPTKNLDAALDDLRGLADVLAFSEGTVDITAAFVDTKDVLAGLRAERQSVLHRLELADTQEEVDNLKFQLNALNNRIAGVEADLRKLQHRAQQSSVTLTVTSDGARDDGGDGDWSIGDAIDDAGHVLTVAAGVALISAAVLLPLALIAAIFYVAIRAANNRAREKALDK